VNPNLQINATTSLGISAFVLLARVNAKKGILPFQQ
jgi:hypothetical protein